MVKVRNYTTEKILKYVKSLPSYKKVPSGYWLVAIRSNEDTLDVYDDKLYVFKGQKSIDVMSCTTNSGAYGLKNFFKWNVNGTAVIKSGEWYYDVYQKGLHKGRMTALRQVGDMIYYRDGNKDNKIDETGKLEIGNNNTNLHCNDYNFKKGIKSWFIGGWSVGCIVVNDLTKYYNLMDLVGYNKVSICLIKEFN